jgi:hypothetical protein
MTLCAWLYPESEVEEVGHIEVVYSDGTVEPYTEYGLDAACQRSELVEASEDHISNLFNAPNATAYIDNIALYREGEYEWYAITVGHEGMCMIRDDILMKDLLSGGLDASFDPPDWW